MIFISANNHSRLLSLLLLFVFIASSQFVFADAKKTKIENRPNAPMQLFPDEYSDLDDLSTPHSTDDQIILKSLERARQKYLQALTFIHSSDTLSAARSFEDAIKTLNRLSSYPDIDQNEDFTDLAQSIIEDYESFIQNIDDLNDDSPFFMIRESFFRQIESGDKTISPEFQSIDLTEEEIKEEQEAIAGLPGKYDPKNLPEAVIPLPENEYVDKTISFISRKSKKTGRRFFKTWLERSGRWFTMMKRIAEEEGVPQEIIYLSMWESGLQTNAVSKAKAVGLWQFIRSTGKLYGLNATTSVWVDERRDPEKATRAAMKHLRDLYHEFGDWHLALAAYNCGPGGVRRAMRRAKKPDGDFWEIRHKLPRETRNYVPAYIATTKVAMDPEKYGFSLDSLNYHDEYVYDTFTLTEPLSLELIAKCSGTTVDSIQSLNPELLRSITPPDVEEYKIKLPLNSSQIFAANYSMLSEAEKQPWVMHKVQRRESITSIARKYGVTKQEIVSANSLRSTRSKLRRGSTIKVPITKQNVIDEEEATLASNNGGLSGDGITHTVQRGETLYSIASKYGIRLTDLRNWNAIPYDNDNIKVGSKLVIAQNKTGKNLAGKKPKLKKIETPKIYKHKVRRGETLAKIADDFNVSIASIKKDNNLRSSKIFPGQVLKIESTGVDVASNKKSTAKKKSTPKKKTTTHKVRKGETIGTVAARYGMSTRQLKNLNPGKIRGNTIYAGSRLKVYDDYSKGSSSKSKKTPNYYRVRRGDTMSSISKKFGISLNQLKRLNKNVNPNRLSIGQKLRVQ